MDVIAHQHVRMNPASRFRRIFAEPVQVGPTVIVGDEADLAIVAALDYMERHALPEGSGAGVSAWLLRERFSGTVTLSTSKMGYVPYFHPVTGPYSYPSR
jgi:hypothetical protein